MGLHYFREVHSANGTVLSVDMVTINGKFFGKPDDAGFRFWRLVRNTILVDYEEWVSYKLGSYRYQYTVECSNGCTFWFGIGFNSPQQPTFETAGYWRIEFNPNKVFDEFRFLKVYLSLLQLSNPRRTEIKRFDLAVDYLVNRSCCSLVKDGRTYTEYCNSVDDRTQSLGHRSCHGYVKLYNKQLESKLPIPLTRLELTIDYKKRLFADVQKIFPTVYLINDYQLKLDSITLSDTDQFILLTCLENPAKMKLLGYYKRKKVESYLATYSQLLQIDKKSYMCILKLLDSFVNLSVVFDNLPDQRDQLSFNDFYQSDDFQDMEQAEYDDVMRYVFCSSFSESGVNV